MNIREFGLVCSVLVLGGCGSSDSSGAATACAVTNPAIAAVCNECLRASCCSQFEACKIGTPCNDCAKTGTCSTSAIADLTTLGTCELKNCATECGFTDGGIGTGGTPGVSDASVGSGGAPAAGGAANTGAGGDPGAGGVGSGGAPACAIPCGGSCCYTGAICADDGAGNLTCGTKCASNSECAPAAPVCTLQPNGTGACTADTGGQQRCKVQGDCPSGACAPNTDGSGNPVPPYVCVPNDGAAYHGCFGAFTNCGSGFCCFTDTASNQFCASECQNSSQCGGANCVTYSTAHAGILCGSTGCGP